jgi:hypothetical protein
MRGRLRVQPICMYVIKNSFTNQSRFNPHAFRSGLANVLELASTYIYIYIY